MGCDYHQFFTKRDLQAKKLAFVDSVDNVVEDAKVDELLKTYAHEVSVDYVLTCTVKSVINVFNYFPLKYADWYVENGMSAGKRYTKSKYLKDIDTLFNRISFCSDEEYVNGFSTKFKGFWFPECCRKELICMKKAYADAKHFKPMVAKIDNLSKAVISKCKSLLDQTDFNEQRFYDLEYSASYIGVFPKYGCNAMIINATTC